jgi:hypothetical protein
MVELSPQVGLRSARADELHALLQEYVGVASLAGAERDRLDAWAPLRAAARRHWEELLEAERFGRDVSEAAIFKLIPHADGAVAQRHGAFVHPVAPAVARDIREWFESSGWVRREQWPELGRGLFDLVRRCTDQPSELWPAMEAFLAVPGASAFTAEMVAPVLHALRPTEFVLLDAACRTLLNHATGSAFGNSLRDFPAAHAAARRLLAELRPMLAASALCDRRPEDVLEGFGHWMIHVRLMRRDGEAEAESEAEADAETAEAIAPAPIEPSLAAADSPSSTQPGPSGAMPHERVAPEVGADQCNDTTGPDDDMLNDTTLEPTPEVEAQLDAVCEVLSPEEALAILEARQAALRAQPAPELAPAKVAELESAAASSEPLGVVAAEAEPAPIAAAPAEIVDSLVAPIEVAPAPVSETALLEIESALPATPAAEPAPLSLFEEARAALERRGQLVLAGPQGSGKSQLARRLAESLVAGGDGFLEHVILHPGWRYADFVQASLPDGSRRPGLFADFCRQAAARSGPCVLVVDDAERGRLAELGGEALDLLDRRGLQVALPGGGSLAVPPNVRLVFTLDDGSRAGRAARAELLRRCVLLRLASRLDEPGALSRPAPPASRS